MLYASQNSLIKRYELEFLLGLARTEEGNLNEVKVTEALEDASHTIDSYLAGRYALPLNSVPAVLERHCCYIARYFLEKNYATEQARRDYDDSIKFLEKVANGSVSLGLSDSEEAPESNNSATIESGGSVWARNNARGFI